MKPKTENNFSQNWIDWIRSRPANRINEVKDNIKSLISKINGKPLPEPTWKNYFFKFTELPPRFRESIVDYARRFDKNPTLTMDFTFIKEKIKVEA